MGNLFGHVSVEVALIGAAIVLGAVLLMVRALRARGARRRRMAGTAFYDRDAEHYGPTGHKSGSASQGWHAADVPIAPSFSAMQRVHRTSTPPPMPQQLGALPSFPPRMPPPPPPDTAS